MYTIETLVPECVGRYICEGNGGHLQLSALINQQCYADCWEAFTQWVILQFDQGHSLRLGPLGVVLVKKTKQGKRNVAEFKFTRKYVSEYSLHMKSGGNSFFENECFAARVNTNVIARMVSLDEQVVKMALGHMFRRVGEVLQQKQQQVLLDMGVGCVVAQKGEVDFVFHEAVEEAYVIAEGKTGESKEDESFNPNSSMRTTVARLRSTEDYKSSQQQQHHASPSSPKNATFNATSNRSPEVQYLRTKYPVHVAKPTTPRINNAAVSPRSLARLGGQPGLSNRRASLISNSSSMTSIQAGGPLKRDDTYHALQHGDLLVEKALGDIRHRIKVHRTPMDAVRERALLLSQKEAHEEDSAALKKEREEKATFGARIQRGASIIAHINKKNLPPVLDKFARTQSATYDEEKFYHSTSSKIGSFFTPSAVSVLIDPKTGHPVTSGAVPFQAAASDHTET